MIEFNETMRCVWFCSAGSFDLLAGLRRDADGFGCMTFRFAHYDKGYEKTDAFEDDSHTKKNWYGFKTNNNTDEDFLRMRDMMDKLVDDMSSTFGVEKWRLWRELDEDLDHYMERFKDLPFVHSRMEKLDGSAS